jgi:hypothetical protein
MQAYAYEKRNCLDLARSNYLDEIRFIDAGGLPDAIMGRPELFAGGRPRYIMPSAKTVIIVSMYIGNTSPPFQAKRAYACSGLILKIILYALLKTFRREL